MFVEHFAVVGDLEKRAKRAGAGHRSRDLMNEEEVNGKDGIEIIGSFRFATFSRPPRERRRKDALSVPPSTSV